MNFDFTYFIHALLIFTIFYFVCAYVIPVIKHRFFVLLFTQLTPDAVYYCKYTWHLRLSDLCAYEKYQLWHYYERRKDDIQYNPLKV